MLTNKSLVTHVTPVEITHSQSHHPVPKREAGGRRVFSIIRLGIIINKLFQAYFVKLLCDYNPRFLVEVRE